MFPQKDRANDENCLFGWQFGLSPFLVNSGQ